MNRPIRIHLRCNRSLLELLEKAVRLNLPLFQCFLRHTTGNMIDPSKQEIVTFRDCCNQYSQLFVHASYRINLADASINRHPALRQELYWAQKLGFTHMILHPGASASFDEGIDALVRALNSIIKSARDIHIVLENVAFTAPSIGGCLEDLQLIRSKLDEPDKLGFL